MNKIKFISTMLIFGTLGIFVKNIKLSSIEIAFLRAIIGCTLLVCAGFIMKQKVSYNSVKKNIWLLLLSGAAIGFNWILLFQAYKYTTIANATLSYYFAPMFVMILSPVVLKERLTIIKIICIVSAISGLFLLLNINNEMSMTSNKQIIGVIYGLAAAIMYASVILMNKFIKGLSGFETTLIQLCVSTLVLFPSIIYNNGIQLSLLNVRAVILILIVGIIHTGVAYLIYFKVIKELEGQAIAILSYIDPITAVFLSAILLGESMSNLQIIGGILILSSTFLSEIRGKSSSSKITKSI
jgi:Predicted permeases